jgi:hypothetical protein
MNGSLVNVNTLFLSGLQINDLFGHMKGLRGRDVEPFLLSFREEDFMRHNPALASLMAADARPGLVLFNTYSTSGFIVPQRYQIIQRVIGQGHTCYEVPGYSREEHDLPSHKLPDLSLIGDVVKGFHEGQPPVVFRESVFNGSSLRV